jgi:DnaJ domain
VTPYAVLLCRPSDGDAVIRKAYHALVRSEHPDANDGEEGARWAELTGAYNAIKTEALRDRWAASRHLRAGSCAACDGCGTTGTRRFKGVVRLCVACGGRGRSK